jgi:pre-mRNA-processing factor SLU7
LAKYGGAEYLETAPKELREGQTEDYVEYSRTGQVIKGRERAKAKSKYPEDGEYCEVQVISVTHSFAVLINNHTAVWGSWYDSSSGVWGYACCHSVIHVSYCSGMAGIEAAEASTAQSLLSSTIAPTPSSSFKEMKTDSKELIDKMDQNYSKKRVGEGNVKLDEERLAQAVSEEKKRKFMTDSDDDNMGKKRKQGGSHDVTEEELGQFPVSKVAVLLISSAEAYRMNRRMAEDPMANYVDAER